jgi:hypothetical protein
MHSVDRTSAPASDRRTWRRIVALVYRLLGLVAGVNSVLERITLQHIGLNWLVLGMLVLISAGGAELLANPEAGVLASLQVPPLLLLLAPLVVLSLFVICIARRNLIFQSTASIVSDGSMRLGAGEAGPGYMAPRVSGWFHRSGGSPLWLLEFPATWDIDAEGTVSLVTRVAGGSEAHSFHPAWEDRSGEWSITLSRAMLTGDVEDGIVYFALSARPALRLHAAEKRKGVVLSVRSPMELTALHLTIDQVLAESARREAILTSKLQAIAAPAQTESGLAQTGDSQRKGTEIAWDKLIDLSN